MTIPVLAKCVRVLAWSKIVPRSEEDGKQPKAVNVRGNKGMTKDAVTAWKMEQQRMRGKTSDTEARKQQQEVKGEVSLNSAG